MKSFEIIVNDEKFIIAHNSSDAHSFIVFNHATCHVIKKGNTGVWETVEHRFGEVSVPVSEIGAAIDQHSAQVTKKQQAL
ncbi:MAG TPA: hypothetical protein VIJ27_13645 [Mucilaginibacter sp.]